MVMNEIETTLGKILESNKRIFPHVKMIEFEKSDKVLITENLCWENSKLWDTCPTKQKKSKPNQTKKTPFVQPKESK